MTGAPMTIVREGSVRWAFLFTLTGVIVFEGRPGSWPFVLVAVGAAWLVVRRLPPVASAPLSATGLLRFVPWFLARSLAGGIDVALRAFRGADALQPGFVRFRTRIVATDARVLFANTVSLLPGTLTARLDGDELVIHTLDTRRPVVDMLRSLEARVVAVFDDVA
jgi:multicomponent Na+:H+ antiporter subunit E